MDQKKFASHNWSVPPRKEKPITGKGKKKKWFKKTTSKTRGRTAAVEEHGFKTRHRVEDWLTLGAGPDRSNPHAAPLSGANDGREL